MSILEGYLIGLAMVIFIGPVLFLLLNTSLISGVRSGIGVALGVIISDLVCVLLCFYGLASLFENESHQFWIGLLGSLIVLGIGIGYLFKKKQDIFSKDRRRQGFWVSTIKGFSVNFFNPFVFGLWIAVFHYGSSKYQSIELSLFMGSILIGVFSMDVLKVFLSKRIKRFISPDRLQLFFKITGVVLILFSIRLLFMVL